MIKSIEVKDIEQAAARLGAPLINLELIDVDSDCNAPALSLGDQVFVDVTYKRFKEDGLYAFRIGEITVIRVAQLMFGKPREESICLYTLDKRYGREYISPELFQEKVIGKLTSHKFGKFKIDYQSGTQ